MTNPVQELMASHRSVRRFEVGRKPAEDVLQRAIRCAQMASSSSNVQGYSLLGIRDPDKRLRLAELSGAQRQVAEAGAFFVVCADSRRHRLLAARDDRPFVPNLETFLVGVVDASLFAQNLTLACESEGLGVCYIGGLRTRLPEVDRLLQLPQDVFVLFGLCVGTPAEDPGERPRLPLEAISFEERYPEDQELLDTIDRYDAEMSAYYGARGKPGYNWSGGIARKFQEPHRAELHGFYEGKGASLD